jgi:alpha-glucoside transport system substrate-binding protein
MRKVMILLIALVLLVVVVGPTQAASDGDTITVAGVWGDESQEADALLAELDAWSKGKVAVEYFNYGDIGNLYDLVLGADPPDVIIAPWPGAIVDLAADGALVDLTRWVNANKLEKAFGSYLITSASFNGAAYGFPVNAFLKSQVWYQPERFAAAGYVIPQTFAELVALSDQMVDDGETPWCGYMNHNGATGWMGTDWIEDLLLSSEGSAVYDDWVAHDVYFQDLRVETAFERFTHMHDTPGYMHDRGNLTSVPFMDNVFPLNAGDCLMHKQATFFSFFFDGSGANPDDFATFAFPPVDQAFAEATLGAGDYVAAVSDDKDVGRLVEFIASKHWGETALADSGWLIPNTKFKTSTYTDLQARMWADQTHAAIKADLFRFDASDLMPPEVGEGTFWSGIVDLVDGTKTIPQVLNEIDASWPTP